MGVEPPFLYDRPNRQSFATSTEKPFNPKAASQASWAPRPARPKHEGPLIDAKEFNRHPDSYFIVPYGNLNWKPMSPRTKIKVKYTRRAQLLLRVCSLLGAVGMLFCVICVKGTDSTLSWIIRATPGIAILHTVYAIYHLARSSKGRTPSSSASYMLFASIVDTCLFPFFVFTAVMAHGQYTEPTDIEGSWQTLFRNDTDTYKITFSLFLLGIVNGSLHLVCLTISLYLAIIFRKIAQLPPDLNPLEDNLTSRHKRNKSSLSTTQTTTNRDSHLSDPLIGPPRVVPFMHTRTESSTSLSSPERRLPNSNRASRTDLPSQIYQQPPSQRASRADVANFSTPHSPTKRSTMYADSRPASARPSSTRPPSTRPQSAHPSLLNDNWFTYPSPSPTPALPETIPAEFRHLRAQSQSNQAPLRNPNIENLTPNPLEMNPPTPPNLIGNDRSVEQRALTAATGNSNLNPNLYKNLNFNPGFPVNSSNSHQVAKPGLNSRPQSARLDSFGTAGSKARFYGELIGTMPREGRVVSSGADAGGKDQSQQQGRGGMRARDVSGKIVEEGRGNGGEYAYRGVEGDGFGERLWRRGNGVAF